MVEPIASAGLLKHLLVVWSLSRNVEIAMQIMNTEPAKIFTSTKVGYFTPILIKSICVIGNTTTETVNRQKTPLP